MRFLSRDEVLHRLHVGLLQIPVPLPVGVPPSQEMWEAQEVCHLTLPIQHTAEGCTVPGHWEKVRKKHPQFSNTYPLSGKYVLHLQCVLQLCDTANQL